jgi:hypothetical protein
MIEYVCPNCKEVLNLCYIIWSKQYNICFFCPNCQFTTEWESCPADEELINHKIKKLTDRYSITYKVLKN